MTEKVRNAVVRPVRLLLAAFSLVLLAEIGSLAQTNEVSNEVRAIVGKVRAKFKDSKKTEADVADELKQFDALLAKHKDEKTDEVASILLSKAVIYLQFLSDTDKGAEIIRQLKRDFPETKPGKQADEILDSIQQREAALKIQRSLVVGAAFPNFEEKDLDGKPLSVAAYKGKVVLIDFWATWCGPCVAELPNVLKAYEKFHPQGFEIIGISLDGDEVRLKNFLKEQKMTWQQFYDGKRWKNKLSSQFGVQSIPATFLLDGEGKIIGKDLRGEALETALSAALAKK